MEMNKYVSVKIVIDKLLKHPLLLDLTLEDAVSETIRFIGLVGIPSAFEDKIEYIDIRKFRGKMPCCIYEINQIRPLQTKVAMRESTDTFHTSNPTNRPKPITVYDDPVEGPYGNIYSRYGDPTFKVQGDYLYTSFPHGRVEMSYKAFVIDDEGFPMVPENSVFLNALELFIKKEKFGVLMDMNKISPEAMQRVERDYSFAVGSALSEGNRISLSQAESLFNMTSSLLPRKNSFLRSFRDLGRKEQIKIHRR